MARVLVVGGASLDVLHVGGQAVSSPGGAGMYTAMAAHRAGATVSLLAPRPRPVPPVLVAVAERVSGWLGPEVAPGELPRFEIAHEGGETRYINEYIGAEELIGPGLLPADLSLYDAVHVIPLGSLGRQEELLRACRQQGARVLSAGTYLVAVQSDSSSVRRVMDAADVFFLNDAEALELFGSLDAAAARPGRVLFVTRGAAGVRVLQGGFATDLPGLHAPVVDPTGAGDTFCGATLAGLAAGEHPVAAARSALPLAASMIGEVGPAVLLRDDPLPVGYAPGPAAVNHDRVRAVAALVAQQEEAAPFPFVGPGLPAQGDAGALDFFFAVTLQQFGFWNEGSDRYDAPMIAELDGRTLKGSDYLFAAFLRAQARDPGFCAPARQAALTAGELADALRADDGADPLPAPELHLEAARSYGADMMALGLTPAGIVRRCRASDRPLRELLSVLDRVGGYKEDPLRKKSGLLALILAQRPEGFLRPGPGETMAPVIDYHLMRSCLRTGLVEIRDPVLRRKIAERRLVGAAEEDAVRRAAWQAIDAVGRVSGRSTGAVDWFFFGARRRCPEMSAPECSRCPLDPACAHRVELFQPVLRTTFY